MSTFSNAEIDLLERVMSSRRDVRGNQFEATPIPTDVLDRILRAGIAAPSVGYSQPWRFVVVREFATKQAIKSSFDAANAAGAARFEGDRRALYQRLRLEGITEAPVNIAVFYQPSSDAVLGQTSMVDAGRYSVVCAIQNMWLMARALDIGMGWVSILEPELVKDVLDAPVEAELVGYLCLGYVTEFLDSPELESLGWDQRRDDTEVFFDEKF